MALPLLPADAIERNWQTLQQQHINMNEDQPKMLKMIAYVNRFWIHSVGVQRISVFGCEDRTNNGVESWHSR